MSDVQRWVFSLDAKREAYDGHDSRIKYVTYADHVAAVEAAERKGRLEAWDSTHLLERERYVFEEGVRAVRNAVTRLHKPWARAYLDTDVLAAIDALQTSLSGPAAVRTSEPEPPTSVAPAGEDHGAHVKPIYVDAWDGMAVPYDDHVVAVETAHAAGMREALADFLTSIDEDDPVYLRGHSVGIRDGIQIGRVMAAYDVGWLGAWSMRAAARDVAACKTHIRRRNTARHNGWFLGRTNWYAVKIITVDRDAAVAAARGEQA